MRFKNRYLVVRVTPRPDLPSCRQDPPLLEGKEGSVQAAVTLTSQSVYTAIRDSIAHNFGEYGLSCVLRSLTVKSFSERTGIALVRVNRDFASSAREAVSLVHGVRLKSSAQVTPTARGRGGRVWVPVSCEVLHVGGTIRKSQKFLADLYQKQLLAS